MPPSLVGAGGLKLSATKPDAEINTPNEKKPIFIGFCAAASFHAHHPVNTWQNTRLIWYTGTTRDESKRA